jgi:hypothetical protein
MQATCELDWGDNLVIIDPAEWTYEWWIEPDGNGTGISSTIAEVCNFTLGDDQWHTLRCRVTRIDCPMKVAEIDVRVLSAPTPTTPPTTTPCPCDEHPRSLCEAGLRHPNCFECSEGWVFILASVDDFCLKEYSLEHFQWDYYKRPASLPVWHDPPEEPTPEQPVPDHPTLPMTPDQYEVRGYASLCQIDSNTFGTVNEKRVLRMEADFDAEDITDAEVAYLHCWTGTGAQPGQLFWQNSTPRKIDRLSICKSAEHRDQNTRPARVATFQFYRSGSHIAFRFIIGNSTGKPVVGGAVAINWAKAQILGARFDYE